MRCSVQKSMIFLAIATCLFLITVNIFIDYKTEFLRFIPALKNPDNRSELLLDYCHLLRLNPWDQELTHYNNPYFKNLKHCKTTFKKLTEIVNNSIIVHPGLDVESCVYHCVTENFHENYIHIPLSNGSKPTCDIVYIVCVNESIVIHRYLHALVYRNETMLPTPDSPDMPSVHLIILDAVSSSQLERSMVQTASYLRNKLESQRMKYLNKIGLNSRPNGYGFLFGKSKDPIPVSPISLGYSSDFPTDPCTTYLDNDSFIGFRYRDAGYVTYMAEDWSTATMNWQNCNGFKNPPTHHYWKPYSKFFHDPYIREILHKRQCKEEAHDMVEYFERFLNTYPDRPSFTINWFTYLAHENINGLYHMDDYFYRFFKRNEKHWDNSYVIVMGDHGNRIDKARNTAIGEAEDNNPMLWISVPKNLRKPEVLHHLWENSNKLITQFDVYATLANLVHPKNSTHSGAPTHGEDLFGPLSEPRTCDRLRIPMQYCICDFNRTVFPLNDPFAISVANQCVEKINQDLKKYEETKNKCAKLSLNINKTVAAESLDAKENQIVLLLTFWTSPGTGQFSAVAVIGKNGIVRELSETFPRLEETKSNAFGNEADCIKDSPVKDYCFCKDVRKTVLRKNK